jgi:outer membrane protein
MKFMVFVVLSGAVSLTAPDTSRGQGAPAETPAEHRVTLGEAVQRALEVQPAMVEAEGNRRTASAADRSAWGAFLPTLSTSASASRNSTGRIDTNTGLPIPPGYVYTVGLAANLELFDGFRRYAEKKQASASLDAADAGLTNQRFQVTLTTKQLFYDAAAQEELVRVAGSQLDRARQQLDVSRERLRLGTATRSDTLRSAVEVGNARITLIQAQANLAVAQMNLGRQIGLNEPARALPDSVLPPVPDPEVLRESVEGAPEVVQAEALAKAARAGVWSARSQYWPSVTLSYVDNRQGADSPFTSFGDYRENFTWRFALNWTLFNGLAREGSQVSASVQKDVNEARAAEARRQVNADFTRQFTSLSTAFQQIDIAATNVEAASEDLRVQAERYRMGAATTLDLLTSQSSLTQAQVSLIQARFTYLIARAGLEALIGREI